MKSSLLETLHTLVVRNRSFIVGVDFATWKWKTSLLESTTLSPPHSCLNKRVLFSWILIALLLLGYRSFSEETDPDIAA